MLRKERAVSESFHTALWISHVSGGATGVKRWNIIFGGIISIFCGGSASACILSIRREEGPS
jgi:hypothetical protein